MTTRRFLADRLRPARAGLLGIWLAPIALALAGCEAKEPPPFIDLGTKGGLPGSVPEQNPAQAKKKLPPTPPHPPR